MYIRRGVVPSKMLVQQLRINAKRIWLISIQQLYCNCGTLSKWNLKKGFRLRLTLTRDVQLMSKNLTTNLWRHNNIQLIKRTNLFLFTTFQWTSICKNPFLLSRIRLAVIINMLRHFNVWGFTSFRRYRFIAQRTDRYLNIL